LTKPHAGLLVSPQKAYWRCFETVKRLGWTIVDASEKDLRIEASDKSLWFGRISDIVIRVRPAGTIGSRVDVRAQSRDGENDHGRNAARLKAFFRQFHF
jgi:fatty-acyl-CoA synthase